MGGIPFRVQILLREKIVGSVYNFSAMPNSSDGTTACENCIRQEQAKSLSSGQVTLTGALLTCAEAADSGLSTLQKDDVVPYLKANLQWRVLIVRRLPLAPLFSRPRTAHIDIVYRLGAQQSHCQRSHHWKFQWRSVLVTSLRR